MTIEELTPAERFAVQDWNVRRSAQLRWPTGNRRRTDKVPMPSRLSVRCVCRVPIMVTERSRAVVCQTCRRPLRAR